MVFPHDEFKKTIPLLYYILQMTCVFFFPEDRHLSLIRFCCNGLKLTFYMQNNLVGFWFISLCSYI